MFPAELSSSLEKRSNVACDFDSNPLSLSLCFSLFQFLSSIQFNLPKAHWRGKKVGLTSGFVSRRDVNRFGRSSRRSISEPLKCYIILLCCFTMQSVLLAMLKGLIGGRKCHSSILLFLFGQRILMGFHLTWTG